MYGVNGCTPLPLKLLLGVAGDGGKVVTPIVGVRGKVAVDGIVW